MRRFVPFVLLPALAACGGSAPSQAPASPAAALPAPQQAPAAAPAADPNAPLSLTDDRLQTYIAYRHELHATALAYLQDMGKAGKHADQSSTDAGKTLTVFQDMEAAGQKHKAEIDALHTKYGFSDAEDKRIWGAVTAVAAASPDNPMMQKASHMFEQMEKQGGPAKKAADDYFAKMAADQKKGMDEATEKYGADAVAVLSRHTKELYDLQMDALHATFGKGASPAAR
jgi:hypothetical protein